MAGPRARRTFTSPVATVISPVTEATSPVTAAIVATVSLNPPADGGALGAGGGSAVTLGAGGTVTVGAVSPGVVAVALGGSAGALVDGSWITGISSSRGVKTRRIADRAINPTPIRINRRPRRRLTCRASTD